MVVAKLQCVVLDCADVDVLSRFYQSLLGGVVNRPDPRWSLGDGWATLHADNAFVLAFQRVEDYQPPQWPDSAHPQQFHLDLAVEDLDQAQEDVLALGATLLNEGSRTGSWRIFADTAGHPFCLVRDQVRCVLRSWTGEPGERRRARPSMITSIPLSMMVKAAPVCHPARPCPHRADSSGNGPKAEELCTPEMLPSPLDAVRAVPDPRTPHLVTHPWPMLLGLVACALLCGARSVRGVIRWASGQDAGTLAALEVPDGTPDQLPVTTTLTRALARLNAAAGVFVQAHTSDPLAGIAGDPPVLQPAADGKTVRGARDSEGLQLHLPGGYQVDPDVMLTQREIRHKPHETVHFTTALDLIADITGAIVTTDALRELGITG